MSYALGRSAELEEEAVYILREGAAQLERPVLLFSGGKDSAVLLGLAETAFCPARLPFPVMHIDTGHNFPEVIAFRDRRVGELGVRLIVRSVQESIERGRVTEEPGPHPSRNRLQTMTLLDGIEELRFDCVFSGGRRDEERSRAKERIFSFRDRHGRWDPKEQRAEVWGLFNCLLRPGEHMRVFPMSNWTEIDVWRYIERELLDLPAIYFSHEREVFESQGMLIPVSPLVAPVGEIRRRRVRFRTVGDMTCTAAVASDAADVPSVIAELLATQISERGATRVDDAYSDAAMEDRKRFGYF